MNFRPPLPLVLLVHSNRLLFVNLLILDSLLYRCLPLVHLPAIQCGYYENIISISMTNLIHPSIFIIIFL